MDRSFLYPERIKRRQSGADFLASARTQACASHSNKVQANIQYAEGTHLQNHAAGHQDDGYDLQSTRQYTAAGAVSFRAYQPVCQPPISVEVVAMPEGAEHGPSRYFRDNSLMEQLFRSLKSGRTPPTTHITAQEALLDISNYLIDRHFRIRPHQF